MKSPDSIPSQEEKWTNCSAQKCKAVYDILDKLQIVSALPEGKTADDPSLETAGDIMDYAERVSADNVFWASVPVEISTRLKGYTVKKGELKNELSELIEESR